MARRVRDAKLETRAARERLQWRAEPYYRSVAAGLHVGYRKGKNAAVWVMRYRTDNKYKVETIADADDNRDADGVGVLDWWQAVDHARALLAQRESAAREGPARDYTVGDALDAYLAHAKERQKAYRDTEITVERLIRPEFGDLPVTDLTTDKIRKWHNTLASTPPRVRTKKGGEQQYANTPMDDDTKRRRKSTANRVLTVLKAALNRAFREEQISDDKAWRRVEAFEDVDSARIRYLTVPEAQRLMNACEPDFRNLVQAALQTGCRYGELCRLKVSDFIPASGTIAINESKSGKPRHVVLTPEGVDFFMSVTVGKGSGDTMLTKANGDAWAESHQSRPMALACERAKIDPPIGFHGLRHTWASLSVMQGMPLMLVAKNLGHVDTRMVEKHYGHFAPSLAADAIRANAPRFDMVEGGNVTQIG